MTNNVIRHMIMIKYPITNQSNLHRSPVALSALPGGY